MTIDPSEIPSPVIYRHLIACITPRPIAWVSTLLPFGVTNLAPFSFFNGIGANPPAVMFSAVNRSDGSRKDTVLNIEATRQFVVNVVSYSISQKMNCTSAELPREVSEFEACGLTPLPSIRVKPPRVKESFVQMECELIELVHIGEGPLAANVIIGRIVMLHADEHVLDPTGQINPEKLDTVGRMGGASYARTRDRFDLQRP